MHYSSVDHCDKIIFKRGLKAKSMAIFKVGLIVLDEIGVDSILFKRSVPEIFDLKREGPLRVKLLLLTLMLIALASLVTPFQC